eukprot:comp20074_c0_seq1/m.39454 comp20074_c0_seq1/g.39454  ORF comp20074_c0_seq1/g.39454 comp20074_c0_seq1/m.39454 type:complete len:305 (-) comp20074_c0_seq1:6-920(-)
MLRHHGQVPRQRRCPGRKVRRRGLAHPLAHGILALHPAHGRAGLRQQPGPDPHGMHHRRRRRALLAPLQAWCARHPCSHHAGAELRPGALAQHHRRDPRIRLPRAGRAHRRPHGLVGRRPGRRGRRCWIHGELGGAFADSERRTQAQAHHPSHWMGLRGVWRHWRPAVLQPARRRGRKHVDCNGERSRNLQSIWPAVHRLARGHADHPADHVVCCAAQRKRSDQGRRRRRLFAVDECRSARCIPIQRRLALFQLPPHQRRHDDPCARRVVRAVRCCLGHRRLRHRRTRRSPPTVKRQEKVPFLN